MNWLQSIKVFSVLQRRDFSLLWVGQLLSNVGDDAFRVAFIWAVVDLTGSARAASVVFMSYIGVYVVVAALAGTLVDRLSRKRIMISVDSVRCLTALSLALVALSHSHEFWLLVAAYGVFGAADAFFYPAFTTFVADVSPEDARLQANSMVGMGRQAASIGGPLLGGLLVAQFGVSSAFMFDAATFIMSLLSLSLIRESRLRGQDEAGSSRTSGRGDHAARRYLRSVRDGIAVVLGIPWLWVTIVVAAIVNAAVSGTMEVSIPFYIGDVLSGGANLLGRLFTFAAIGAVCGALITGQMEIRHHRHEFLVAYLLLLAVGVSFVLVGLIPDATVLLAGASVFGLSLQAFNAFWITTLQDRIPTETLGRVLSVDQAGSYASMPLGLALAGLVAAAKGPSVAILLSGLVIAIGVTAGLAIVVGAGLWPE